MQVKTRDLFDKYQDGVATSNGLAPVRNQAVPYTPERQQMLFSALGENANFLKHINHIPVEAQVGQKIGLGINKPVASRTNTDIEERKTRYMGDLKGDEYHAKQTNFDFHLSYKLMDSWAHAGDFGKMYIKQVVKQIARDNVMIGWHGKEAADETDIATNTMLEDVNVGWLEKARIKEPARYMGYDSDGVATTDEWTVGENGNYPNLDTLVFDMIHSLMDAWHEGADDLVVMVGRGIWVAHGLSLLANSTLPTERNALATWFAAETVAGLPCVLPPFFPKRGVLVTSYENLSIYHQLGTFRRTPIDNPKRDRVEEYISENQAYSVEDYGKFAAVRDQAILLPDGAGGWA